MGIMHQEEGNGTRCSSFGNSFKYLVGVVLPPGRGQELACWDLESRSIQLSGLGARIDATGWGLCSQFNINTLSW